MAVDLEKFGAELRAVHDRLTAEFEEQQRIAESAWEELESRSKALTEFREQYGAVIRALDGRQVHVVGARDARERIVIGAADVLKVTTEEIR